MNYDDPRQAAKRRRRLARMRQDKKMRGPAFNSLQGATTHGFSVVDVESAEQAKRRGRGSRKRMATISSGSGFGTAEGAIARTISESLDPSKAPRKVETLAEMSPEKKAEMMRLYGKK